MNHEKNGTKLGQKDRQLKIVKVVEAWERNRSLNTSLPFERLKRRGSNMTHRSLLLVHPASPFRQFLMDTKNNFYMKTFC